MCQSVPPQSMVCRSALLFVHAPLYKPTASIGPHTVIPRPQKDSHSPMPMVAWVVITPYVRVAGWCAMRRGCSSRGTVWMCSFCAGTGRGAVWDCKLLGRTGRASQATCMRQEPLLACWQHSTSAVNQPGSHR